MVFLEASLPVPLNLYLLIFSQYTFICGLFSGLLLIITWVFSSGSLNRLGSEKFIAYECGFDPFCDSHIVFDVKYYLIAILFILFDLEIVYLLPWILFADSMILGSCLGLIFFLSILLFGFFYEWIKGALEWN